MSKRQHFTALSPIPPLAFIFFLPPLGCFLNLGWLRDCLIKLSHLRMRLRMLLLPTTKRSFSDQGRGSSLSGQYHMSFVTLCASAQLGPLLWILTFHCCELWKCLCVSLTLGEIHSDLSFSLQFLFLVFVVFFFWFFKSLLGTGTFNYRNVFVME